MIQTDIDKTKDNKKIKIAFISLFSNISGATLAMLEIIDKLIEDGNYEVVVITGSRGALEEKLRERNIQVYKCLFFSWLKGKGVVEEIKVRVKCILSNHSEKQIYEFLKKKEIDVLHINTGISHVGIKSANKLGIPVIWHLREEPLSCFNRKPYDKKQELYCLRQADLIITISKYIYNCYKDKFNHNARVIYDGVYTDGYEKLRIKDIFSDVKVHMSLCGYNAFKGHEEAIEALSILYEEGYTNIYLHFYGDIEPSFKKSLIALTEKKLLQEHVIFEGYVNNMPKRWAESDIGLMCSDGEGFGRATVEAMATGALVIGADKGATPEIIENGRGFLYEKGNAKELASEILYALKHPEEARKIAKRGQDYIISGTFSMDKNIESLKLIYREVIEKNEGSFPRKYKYKITNEGRE